MTNITEIVRILKLQFSLLGHSCVKISDKRLKKDKLDEIKPLGLYVVGSVEPAPAAHKIPDSPGRYTHTWAHIMPGIPAMRALFSCSSKVKSPSLGFPPLLLACLSHLTCIWNLDQ